MTPRILGAPHSPRQNLLLAALPAAEYERLLPTLEPEPLLPGLCLHSAGDRDKYLYFPTAGIVARSYVLEDGAQAGISLVGNDGAVGLAGFLSGDSTPSRAVVIGAGYAYRLRAEALKAEFARFGPLARLLLRYTLALIAQITQTAVCNRFHSVEQQMCRLVLSCLDLQLSNELAMTQGMLADTLGVRREGVTEAAGRLQAAGAIRCTRGRITVIDRASLQARACECYAVVRQEYERLLPAVETEEQDPAGWNGGTAGRIARPASAEACA